MNSLSSVAAFGKGRKVVEPLHHQFATFSWMLLELVFIVWLPGTEVGPGKCLKLEPPSLERLI